MRLRRSRPGTGRESEAAHAAERLAVLLGAGIPPAAAWAYAVGEVVDDVAGAMHRRGWPELGVTVSIATTSGASLGPALRGLAGALRDAEQTTRDAAAALAGPVATARLILALPAVGVLFGVALGFDTLTTLFATALGWACLAAGAALLLLALWWNRALVRSATRRGPPPGLGCDLLVVALGGGAPVAAAIDNVEDACAKAGVEVDLVVARDSLALSQRAGVPAGELLRSAADEARRTARSDAAAAAGRLGVRLMLPLGVCVLPAFFAVGVIPLLASVVGATLG